MSQQPSPETPTGFDPGMAEQPSEEQVQQMLAQMRVLPVDQHLAQVLQLLLEGAQVKIGRNDGRLLLDATAAFVQHVRAYADAGLIEQVDEALAQLRMAQVQAESEIQRAAAEGGHAEANDLPAPPVPGFAAPPGDSAPATDGAQGAAGSAQQASRLWTPGT